MKKFFLSIYSGYIRFFCFPAASYVIRRRARKIADSFSGRVVDIGAGEQPYRNEFRNVNPYLVHNSPSYYLTYYSSLPDNRTDYWADRFEDVNIPDQSLDGALCFQVLNVVEDPAAFFVHVFRKLKPGGKLLLSTDTSYPKWHVSDYFRFTDAGIRMLAEKAGFRVVSVESNGGYALTEYLFFTRFMKDYPKLLFSSFRLLSIVGLLCMIPVIMAFPLTWLAGAVSSVLAVSERKSFSDSSGVTLMAEKPVL
ncbi:MAG: class I SAM-dependent methyltransferase [Bacteroidetes bacterium]|nr:class I SAM-dependent methyltransferase [Bacteroidota bacterium]MBU1721130.1 class I SAM-dependent methyltransferase [Bacteroidota bacterium]